MHIIRIQYLAAFALIATAACSKATEQPAPAQSENIVAGWYLQRDGQHLFQACGQAAPSPITASDDLLAKVREFGITENSPVYAKLLLEHDNAAGVDKVVRVEKIGSDTPVMNCSMNGVAIPPAGGSR